MYGLLEQVPVLRDDEAIETSCPNDRVDFAPALEEDDVVEKAPWPCSDAPLHELRAVEGEWAETMPAETGY